MARKQGLTVAVTGASGYIGARLIDSLDSDDRVERILGFDVRPPKGVPSPKLVFDAVDVRDPALVSRFSGIDVVVHLAFVMDAIRDETEMRDINVNGTQNVFRSAGKAGVRKVVYTSSGVAYGAHPDNDVPLTEESPLRANFDFGYAAHKMETEYVVKEFRDEYPDAIVTVLRPAVVFGPHVNNSWSHLLEIPVMFHVAGHKPPFQFVHEDDVGAAAAFAVFNDLDGPYNLCPRDWLEFEEITAITNRRVLAVPEPAAFAMADRMWGSGFGEVPAGYLHYVMYPWVMSPDRLEAAGFKCERSSYDAFMDTWEVAKQRVRLGRASMDRSDLRKGAFAGAGLLLGAALWRGVRRRRS